MLSSNVRACWKPQIAQGQFCDIVVIAVSLLRVCFLGFDEEFETPLADEQTAVSPEFPC